MAFLLMMNMALGIDEQWEELIEHERLAKLAAMNEMIGTSNEDLLTTIAKETLKACVGAHCEDIAILH
jgi:hypothetical protein